MGRYFAADEDNDLAGEAKGQKEEVFNITKSQIKKAKRDMKGRNEKSKRNKGDEEGAEQRRRKKRKRTGEDAFPGKAPVNPEALDKQNRGPGIDTKVVRTKFARKETARREAVREQATELAARSELLLAEEAGLLEGDETHEFTGQIKQTEIRSCVDQETASKGFELNLQNFGPYKIDYTRNGRHLLIGGRRGHVAAFDWISKKLKCEINVQESVHDVQWLHTENMYAVAQKKWTYIYDNQGIEIHCLKKLDNIQQMEFLPYHFLLAAGSDRGFLSWVDVSIGKMVAQFPNGRLGPISVMCQNPQNAVLCLGHSKGTVTMWTPNMKEPVAKMLAHKQPVRAVAVDNSGTYLATAGVDRSLKIWDIRQFKCLKDYRIPSGAACLAFSGRGFLAAGLGGGDGIVEIYKDACTTTQEQAYMRHRVHRSISSLSFAPYEDVLGIGHSGGISSILIPGSGEPNFDALEANPFQTKQQRREAEVKSLLEKVSPELISLDPSKVGDVNVSAVMDSIEDMNKKLFIKPRKVDFEPRHKMKGKGGTAKKFHIKRTVQDEEMRRDLKKQVDVASEEPREGKPKKKKQPKSVLDRLK